MSAKYFDNDWHSSSPDESITLTIRLIFCWTAVFVRIGGKYARKSSRNLFGWDDVLIVVALIIGSAGPITTLWSLTKGGALITSILIKEKKYADAQKYLLALWISNNLLFITLCLIRLSILVFYQAVFGVSTTFRKISIGLGVINILWALGAVLGNIFICKPISHYWDPLSPGACVQPLRFLLIVSILDIFLDFVLLILPIPQLLKLNVSVRTRVAIVAIFWIGVFAVVSNIIRLKYLYQPGRQLINAKRAVIWTSVHVTTAFICACLPLSKPLFIKLGTASHTISQYARSLLGSRSGSQHSLGSLGRRQPKTSSENSFRLDDRQYENAIEIHGNSASGREEVMEMPSDKSITVIKHVDVA